MSAPSFAGGPGLFEVPTATSLPDGEIALAYNRAKMLDPLHPLLWQNNGFFTVAFLPRLTLTARGSVRHSGTDDDIFNRDESANVQVLLLDERGWRPALSAGLHDVSGANALYTAKYATLTKSVAGRVRLTAGYGSGVRLLDGPFGGVEIAPCPWITFIAEHDSRQRSAGVRVHPFPSLAERFGVRPTLDASWLGEQGFVAGVGVRFAAGPARQHRPLPAPRQDATAPRAFGPSDVAVERAAASVRDALVAAGLENVRVLPFEGGVLDVQYENRRWLLDDMDGLGVVLGIVAAHVPAEVERVRVTIRKVDVPVLVVTTALAPWRAFLADARQERAFVEQLAIEFPAAARAPIQAVAANSSLFRVDLTARPRVETILLSELSALETRVSVLPEFNAQLGRGLMLSGRTSIPVTQSSRFLEDLGEVGGDRLLLHAGARIPSGLLPRGAMGIGQLSVGRLGHRQVGAHWDQNVALRGGRWSVGLTGAMYGDAASRIKRSYGFGTVRWRRPQQEIATALSVGVFRFGDVGAVAEVSRRLGLVEVGFYVRATDLASQAGARVTVPLSPRRQARPRAVRVLLPDFFEHAEDVTILEDFPAVRIDVARSLDIGHGVVRDYAGRDWLHEGTIRARAWAIRNAALRER
ncbi:MAG: YjbH domain-containing protein [Gemmatimonadaceae bacterium]|nr:YjbH domain-containing protein [Gemmatimonadaceae bacterium]